MREENISKEEGRYSQVHYFFAISGRKIVQDLHEITHEAFPSV